MNKEVSRQLHIIHRERTRFGAFPTSFAVVVSLYIQRDYIFKTNTWMIYISLLIYGAISRAVINEYKFDEWVEGKPWARRLYLSSFFASALAIGIHFFDVFSNVGADSSNTGLILLMATAFVTAASIALVADKVIYHTYVLTINGCCLLTYIYHQDFGRTYVMAFIAIYYVFSIGHYKLGRTQLIDLLEAQYSANEEKERLKNIINMVPGFVIIFDASLVITMASKATLNYFPDILGKKIGTLDSHSNWEDFVANFMKSEKSSSITEIQTTVNNEKMWALLHVEKTENQGGIIVSIKTNELIEAKRSLQEHEAKAQYAAKLASLGEMAAGIAHEINNPLTIIQGSASIIQKLLDKEPVDMSNVKYLCGKLVETTERISKTVRILKALSRNAERDPFNDVNIEKLLHQGLDICGSRFKRHDVELTLPEFKGPIVVQGREVELGQVLLNLLGNAVDATKFQAVRKVAIRYEINHPWFDLLVEDSGPGVPDEIRNKIMEPFFSTKEVNAGTGLGLSISKRIMETHGGELTLLDGTAMTTFRMRIPYSA